MAKSKDSPSAEGKELSKSNYQDVAGSGSAKNGTGATGVSDNQDNSVSKGNGAVAMYVQPAPNANLPQIRAADAQVRAPNPAMPSKNIRDYVGMIADVAYGGLPPVPRADPRGGSNIVNPNQLPTSYAPGSIPLPVKRPGNGEIVIPGSNSPADVERQAQEAYENGWTWQELAAGAAGGAIAGYAAAKLAGMGSGVTESGNVAAKGDRSVGGGGGQTPQSANTPNATVKMNNPPGGKPQGLGAFPNGYNNNNGSPAGYNGTKQFDDYGEFTTLPELIQLPAPGPSNVIQPGNLRLTSDQHGNASETDTGAFNHGPNQPRNPSQPVNAAQQSNYINAEAARIVDLMELYGDRDPDNYGVHLDSNPQLYNTIVRMLN